jgi:4-hydroxybenzoyl-CoA thioesterase
VVDNRARFLIPTRFCDDVVIETQFAEVGRASFRMQHRLTKDGALAVEASETRVWVVRDPARPGRFKAQPLPADVVAKFTAITAPA